jgi:polar amino acid transport system substrate-binding protein
MALLRRPLLTLLAMSSTLLVACQKPKANDTTPTTSTNQNAANSGQLRAVVIGDELPMVRKTDKGYDGLSFVVLEAIRDQLNAEQGEGQAAVTLTTTNATDVESGLEMIRSGKADIACGVGFSWERQKQFDYTLPFASSGIRLLAPTTIDGTPNSLEGQTIGVVANSVAASVLANNVDNASFKSFATPADALNALKKGDVKLLAGDSLWLRANQNQAAPDDVIVPAVPYARAAIGCIVGESSSSLLDTSNIAIGRLLQAYVDGNQEARQEINAWIGPDSAIGLTDEQISHYYRMVLSTAAEFQPTP